MTTEPTDAELKALLLDKLPASKHYIRPVIEKMVAAMQAAIDKWGQPAQATKGRKVFVCTNCDGVYVDQPVTRCDCLPDENTFTEGWICFGAPAQAAEPVAWAATSEDGVVEALGMNQSRRFDTPLYLAPQPVAREPLTEVHIQDLLICGDPTDEEMRLIRIGWDAANGIKGGQHVS